ncbi:MAG: hypothetical protein IPP85_11205 [Propionivibrio sp.]|nr:hypothetical protein [Propionivibrio sp.]
MSYPTDINLGFAVLELPKSLSTLFVVSWEDKGGKISSRLTGNGFERHLPIYDALAAIAELLLAYKLVRIGHADGRGLRTIGIGDTLIYFSAIDGVQTGDLNVGLKNYEGNSAWLGVKAEVDPHGTTAIAAPHVGSDSLPIARRYVRCFELLEHGFYSEAFIVAFSVLDDLVQQVLHESLCEKGLASKTERDELLRGIKENRLKLYLGPVLKLACGRDISTMWPASTAALEWLNSTRNRIAHSAEAVDYAAAAKAIFACLRVVVALKESGLTASEIPVELFRHAKITAAWTMEPPAWVPKGELAESMDFQS